MRNRCAFLLVLLTLILLVTAAGCRGGAGADVETEPEPPATETATGVDDRGEDDDTTQVGDKWGGEDTTAEDMDRDPAADAAEMLVTIYFGFDSYELDETSLSNLSENATWMRAHPEVPIVVEGHCDERGTIEYNLALGERRANAVRDYLDSLGVERSQVRIVTFGEERPVNRGHNESAWSQNRRAEFVVDR